MVRVFVLTTILLGVIFYGTQLDAIRFLELLGVFLLLAAGNAFLAFKKVSSGRARNVASVILLASAFFIWIAVAWRLWRNPDRMLVAAAAGGYPRLIVWSLQHGAHVNGNGELVSPLMYALNGNQLVSVETLVRSGADVNHRDKSGRTALMSAAGRGHVQIVQYLCEAGADVKLNSDDGGTALNEAADFGQTAVVRFLIEHGAPVDQRGEAGRTALIDGAAHPDIVRVLLAAKASVNLQANDGVTALMVAAGRDEPESAELLLKAGADPTVRDREGRTAVDLAKQYNAAKVISILTR